MLNVSDSDPDHIEHARERLGTTLLTYAAKRTPTYGVNDLARILVAILNGRSALRARLDGKLLLQERSGFDHFIAEFTAWLQRHEGVQERSRRPRPISTGRCSSPLPPPWTTSRFRMPKTMTPWRSDPT
ncbi:hypothetical protein [Luteibacter sahnii]|uniref:hypothetical protein n=1 Tax=Luteibacter sahnii TaxID=3021977 RepID=UPI002A69D5EA|nr:hypothetical protein [Luteibacter sp. PPL193]MDY1550007.1 hypothetical protein [Luteibacter sp. PPL193]